MGNKSNGELKKTDLTDILLEFRILKNGKHLREHEIGRMTSRNLVNGCRIIRRASGTDEETVIQ
jgi:hypothetical protein